MMTERTTHTQVLVLDGNVFLTLPEDQYIKMTPQQARDVGMRLFRRSFVADGEPVPSMIIVKEENDDD
jgi:hypothetical protein